MRSSILQAAQGEYLVALHLLLNTLFPILYVLWVLWGWSQAPRCHLQRINLCGVRDGIKEGPDKHGEAVSGHKQVEDGAGELKVSFRMDFCNGYSQASQTRGEQIKS